MTATRTSEESRAPMMDGDAVDRLRLAYPWPATKPEVPDPVESPGWLDEGTDRALALALSDQTKVVVELGAWLGLSARYILENAPNATVISIDHWEGSPEHQTRDDFRSMLATLYETFLSLNWPHRDRIVPLRMSSLEGLRAVAQFGIEPDVIYIDAEHSYRAVTSELELAHELFPLRPQDRR